MTKGTILFITLSLALISPAIAQPVVFREAKIAVDSCELKVQVAESDASREHGLMNRDNVAPWDGMLFVFPSAQPVSFWMKDTRIPLDVGYFDEKGVLKEIHLLKPRDLTPVRSEIEDVKWALELPAGDFEKRGLKVGEILDLKK